MAGTSDFAGAPIDVLRPILMLLHLQDKLRCEGVCKSWMQLLRGSHSKSSRQVDKAVWGTELNLVICGPQNVRDTIHLHRAHSQTTLPVITLNAAQTSQTVTEREFVRWLARRAPSLSKVSVAFDDISRDPAVPSSPNFDGGWVFPQILAALHLCCSSSSGPELRLEAGIEVFLVHPVCLKMLGSLLTDWTVRGLENGAQLQAWPEIRALTSLTRMEISDPYGEFDDSSYADMAELSYLAKMHTMVLAEYCSLSKRVPNYTNLQRLELHRGRDDVCNLSTVTRLTALKMSEVGDAFRQLVLPEGKEVCLKDLQVLSTFRSKEDYDIINLEMATRLTRLALQNAYPRNLKEGPWPREMPCLQSVVLSHLDCSPPVKLSLYSKLQSLDLSGIRVDTLPDWFARLTQLQTLSLRRGHFEEFPQSVLQLSQLQTLDMAGMHSMPLSESIVGIAQWPNLSVLDLTLRRGDRHDLDSHLILLLLNNAFKQGATRSPLHIDNIYTM